MKYKVEKKLGNLNGWVFTGKAKDLGKPVGRCVCGRRIQYGYEIQNKETGVKNYLGSSCILTCAESSELIDTIKGAVESFKKKKRDAKNLLKKFDKASEMREDLKSTYKLPALQPFSNLGQAKVEIERLKALKKAQEFFDAGFKTVREEVSERPDMLPHRAIKKITEANYLVDLTDPCNYSTYNGYTGIVNALSVLGSLSTLDPSAYGIEYKNTYSKGGLKRG